ncbi:UDP-N-acetylmuramoyl-L-alanyl-D-glutamate--2,6-diaminopimelate ligase [Moraxella haemolytica]|uniref:UDP-N-acetylmuramoyl-L-alanyl-D-glutamate--2, 6-diaminopimelate ligase n=1 Tax=Moraxella haemolytica TaxID=2904119 RepID=UPI002542B43F|nr:UDP-N-acetylmuramoyl-L-alanyl-D-glutamate--2,6-diaminopimelate ligase [Moraxella sp. ZY171148]WII95087.1 UDP-N-acetylmuramoyl-L-alanyl-D-glutamate--2,6-diaminopimelate ligase [Moraxella sp. ZY171148]
MKPTTLATLFDTISLHLPSDAIKMVADLPFGQFCLDSRRLNEGDVFVLLSSVGGDQQSLLRANEYLKSVDGKAAFILSQINPQELDISTLSTPIVDLPTIRHYLGDLIAARFQVDRPAKLPTVVAVTGTNGKTTVSQLVAQLCELSGVPSAIMGTAGNGRLGQLVQSANTTGDVLSVHEFLYQMAKDGVQVVALEASSHGLHQHRLQGVPVQVAIYTNLSHDHLDYHADMDDYRAAKARLFDEHYFSTLTHGIINQDATYPLLQNNDGALPYSLLGHSCQDEKADYFVKKITPSLNGVQIELVAQGKLMTLHSPLLGLFNVDNLMAAVAAFLALYPNQQDNLPALVAKLHGARGRMQQVPSKTGLFIVDYAHTPDAIEQVLISLQKHCTGRLIAVFGCGGDRDKSKRPIMANVGVRHADMVILTADNPRSENPNAILRDMQTQLDCQAHYKVIIEPDRKRAIKEAVMMAGGDDIVVILGKGHETYQEINGVRYDFDDVAVVGEFINAFNK